MSAWKLVLRRLYSLGGEAPKHVLDDGTIPSLEGNLTVLKKLGLVGSPGPHGYHNPKPWKVTLKGRLFCEGHIVAIRDGPKGMKWQATWLNPLATTAVEGEPSWQLSLF